MKYNKVSNWNSVWSLSKISSLIWRIHHNFIFKIYKKFLDPLNLKKPDIIELGSGSGELTAKLVKRYNGSAFLIDNNKKAIEISKERFRKYSIKAHFFKKNIFKFKIRKKFDIVHSEGLIEHFKRKKQMEIIEVHKKYVKKNGHIFVCVPRPAWYYKITKWFLEKIDKWPFGFEKAMNKYELKKVLEDCGLKVLDFIEYRRYSFALAKI